MEMFHLQKRRAEVVDVAELVNGILGRCKLDFSIKEKAE